MILKKLLSGNNSKRTRKIKLHVALSFLYRFGSIVSSFLLVPLSIEYLGEEKYGIWLTLSSFLSWLAFFDLGLGHGYRNKFAEAKAKGNKYLVRSYVSSTYFSIGIISILLFLVFAFLQFFIDWTRILNTSSINKSELSTIVFFVFGNFFIHLTLQLIITTFTADQKPSIKNLFGFLTQVILVLGLLLLRKFCLNSLFLFSIVFSTIPVIILLIINLYAFNTIYKSIKPSIVFFNKMHLRNILSLGINFFLIQLSALILFSTDNIIITQIFSPTEVTPYNIATKYFSIVTVVSLLIITPFWSANTEAFVKNDFNWIKRSMRFLIFLSFVFVLISTLMILFANNIYSLWVGDNIIIPNFLTIYSGVFVIISVVGLPFNQFVNGVGKIRLQLYLSVFGAIINIPLSIFLSKNLEMGIAGVKLATIMSNCIGLIFLPIQYVKLINKKASGIWNK